MKTFKEFNKTLETNEAYGDWEDDRAMAAQKAQMPASLGGKHKDKSRPKYTTQVTKQKSQYHSKEEVEAAEAHLPTYGGDKWAKQYRRGLKQNDPERQEKARELRLQRRKARGDTVWTSNKDHSEIRA